MSEQSQDQFFEDIVSTASVAMRAIRDHYIANNLQCNHQALTVSVIIKMFGAVYETLDPKGRALMLEGIINNSQIIDEASP